MMSFISILNLQMGVSERTPETSHQEQCKTETGPRFKVSFERSEKRGIDLADYLV